MTVDEFPFLSVAFFPLKKENIGGVWFGVIYWDLASFFRPCFFCFPGLYSQAHAHTLPGFQFPVSMSLFPFFFIFFFFQVKNFQHVWIRLSHFFLLSYIDVTVKTGVFFMFIFIFGFLSNLLYIISLCVCLSRWFSSLRFHGFSVFVCVCSFLFRQLASLLFPLPHFTCLTLV